VNKKFKVMGAKVTRVLGSKVPLQTTGATQSGTPTQTVKPTPTMTNPLNQLNLLNAKFKRLKDLRVELTKMKALYQEHDRLMEELLPIFVEVNQDAFVMKREITIGTNKYRLAPYFYNEKKGHIVAKVWKSSAFETAVIE
jgi:hypothetical protein